MFHNIKKTILSIETCLGRCSVALLHQDKVTFKEHEKSGMQNEVLFPMIQEILNDAGIKIKDLYAVACTVGPGSFTGVRVGVAAARGMKHVFEDIKLVGVSTLEVIAFKAKEYAEGKPIASLIEARRDEFYTQNFTPDLESINEIEVKNIDDLVLQDCFVACNIKLNDLGKIITPNALLVLQKSCEILSKNKCSENIHPLYIKEPNIT